MRFEDNYTQCFAMVTVLADGQECPEYSTWCDEHDNTGCWIPFTPGQFISVEVALDITSEHFEVDPVYRWCCP